MPNTSNTRRLIAIYEQSMKEHTEQIINDLIERDILDPTDYENDASVLWFDLQDNIFDNRYNGRNIFPTPDVIIRSLNFIRETELYNYGEVLSYQDIDDVYGVDNIFRKTAQYLVEFEINYKFKEWVKDCFLEDADDDAEDIIEIIPANQ
jgi:hypothetical protein